ncbi:MAG TPA: hypothetical protein VGH81_02200 [Rudaea sp.]|jgi:hypothetical protein
MDVERTPRLLIDAPGRRWLLLILLAILAAGYFGVFAVFITASRDFIDARRDRAALRFSTLHPVSVPDRILFGSKRREDGLLGAGWHFAEADGSWSGRNGGGLFIALRPCACDIDLTFNLGVFTSKQTAENGLEIVVNDKSLGHIARTVADAWNPVRITVPESIAASGELHIVLQVDRAKLAFSRRLGEGPEDTRCQVGRR